MRKGELFSSKIPRNPYKRHPEIPANENGFFTAYKNPPKCVRFGRRKSLPAENFRDSPDPVTFGTLDPNDKSFLRNAHRNLSMRLRNRGRKSMKVSGHSKALWLCDVIESVACDATAVWLVVTYLFDTFYS